MNDYMCILTGSHELYFLMIIYVIQKKLGVKIILQFSQLNGKLP